MDISVQRAGKILMYGLKFQFRQISGNNEKLYRRKKKENPNTRRRMSENVWNQYNGFMLALAKRERTHEQ